MSNEDFCKMMGGHPLAITVKLIVRRWLLIAFLVGATILVWINTKGAIAFGAGLFGAFLLWFSLKTIGMSLGDLICGLTNWSIFCKAKSQIEAGALSPSYAFQGTCGICVVDDRNRRIFANGSVFAFSDVRSNVAHISLSNDPDTLMLRHYVDVLLKSGPSFKVSFYNEVVARNMEYRLNCSIRGA
jgi:hypothetical protein